MCQFEVDFGAEAAAHGFAEDAFDDAVPRLETFLEQGLATLEGRRLAMTEPGRHFVRLAATAFDAYLDKGAARHSAAV